MCLRRLALPLQSILADRWTGSAARRARQRVFCAAANGPSRSLPPPTQSPVNCASGVAAPAGSDSPAAHTPTTMQAAAERLTAGRSLDVAIFCQEPRRGRNMPGSGVRMFRLVPAAKDRTAHVRNPPPRAAGTAIPRPPGSRPLLEAERKGTRACFAMARMIARSSPVRPHPPVAAVMRRIGASYGRDELAGRPDRPVTGRTGVAPITFLRKTTKAEGSGVKTALAARAGARFGRKQPFALHLLARELARAADRFRSFPCLPFRGFFVMAAQLHLAENALALHLLLERLQGLVNIVVTNKDLHACSFVADRSSRFAKPVFARRFASRASTRKAVKSPLFPRAGNDGARRAPPKAPRSSPSTCLGGSGPPRDAPRGRPGTRRAARPPYRAGQIRVTCPILRRGLARPLP